LRVPQYEMIKY